MNVSSNNQETPNASKGSTIHLPLGQFVSTPGAIAAMAKAGQKPAVLISRHRKGDWGEIGNEDWNANNDAVEDGERVLSAYQLNDGTKLWVITEADRSATTILLPEEY
jgi:hypothetical protein